MSDVADTAGGALALVHEPALVLVDPAKFETFFDGIAAEARGLKPDTSTEKGRKAIAAMAFKVTRTKTAIDEAGKALNEGARAQIAKVDAARRQVREKLDALRDEVRAPLTAWEGAEAARLVRVDAAMQQLRDAGRISINDTAAGLVERIAVVDAMVITTAEFVSEVDDAIALRDATLATLRDVHARLQREEAERAELARLRAEAAARAEAERVEQERIRAEAEAQQAAERERQAEAERVERERLIAVNAERERQAEVERAEAEGAARARQEADDRATAAQAERDRLHAAELAKVQQERDRADRARRAEEKRRVDEERHRQADADAATARAADREHRGTVMRVAKEAIQEHAGVTEEQAKQVVLAIVGCSVPAVTITF